MGYEYASAVCVIITLRKFYYTTLLQFFLYRISSNKSLWRLFKAEALEGGPYFKKRLGFIFMKFESFVVASFQITVNDNHQDI